MLYSEEPAYSQSLGDGLTLRTAADERDVERVAAFNGIVHGPGVASMVSNLFIHHPSTRARDLVFVEDGRSDQVVSSICLIPWSWRYEGIEIPAGEMAIVGTLEAYRRRGLIRAQVAYFERRLLERGCLLSHIQGIPYYYRQFGYEYALPLEGGFHLGLHMIPEPVGAAFRIRAATLDDLPALMRLYDVAANDLAIHCVRSEAIWRYLLVHTSGTETECENWLLEDADGQVAGYARLPAHHFGEELAVSEVSDLGFDAALTMLNHFKKLATERGKPGIRLNLPSGSALVRLARSLGAQDLGTYAWQLRVPSPVALLRELAPVLDRRIAGSPFAGMTRDVPLNLYRETILLRWVAGKLTDVTDLGFSDFGDIHIPPLQLVPLMMGYRTVADLRAAFPDVRVAPAWRLLVDVLFPRVTSFIYTIY